MYVTCQVSIDNPNLYIILSCSLRLSLKWLAGIYGSKEAGFVGTVGVLVNSCGPPWARVKQKE